MNVTISGPVSSSERTYLHNVLTEVLSDVTTMDDARKALSLGGDILLGYPQFAEVDLKLEPPFLSRKATVPKLLSKLTNVPVLSRLLPKRFHKPTAIANYVPSKKTTGRVFCGVSDGRIIGEVVGSAHLGTSMGSISISYDPMRNMTEGNLEACRLDPLHVSSTKHILIRRESGQHLSNYQSLLDTVFSHSESRETSREGSTVSPLSDTQVEALSLKLSEAGTVGHNDRQQFGSAPFTTELSLVLAEVDRDIPAIITGAKKNPIWEFASPGPACQLSQLDDITRSLHFYRNSNRATVTTQRNTLITSRGVWESVSHRHRDAPLDRYLKIGRQILRTIAPFPNTSVFFGVEPFSRFHFSRHTASRRLVSRIVTGLRTEVAATTAMHLTPSFMFAASGSVHVSEAIDKKRIHKLIERFSTNTRQDSNNNNYNHKAVLSKLTKSGVEEDLRDSIKGKLRGFAEVMSPASFSYVKNELLSNDNRSNRSYTCAYTPVHDGYGCADSSRLNFVPMAASMHIGNGFLARTHLMGIWRSPLRIPISGLNAMYLLAGIEAAIPKDSPLTLMRELSSSGIRKVVQDSLEYAAYTGIHARAPIPVTATISLWSSRALTIRQRFVFGFSLKV